MAAVAEGWGLVVQPIGGGNSIAVAVLGARAGDRVTRLLGLVALAAGVVLFALRDIHGGAAVVGGVLGLLLAPSRLRCPGQR